MKVAIMQPYVFPYIGYYQLINAVDKFVIYDDVTYIKQGWINRNNILVNNEPYLFTLPLQNASSSNLISATHINQALYDIWKAKFLKSVYQSYSKAPFFSQAYPIIQKVLNTPYILISEIAQLSLTTVMEYLNIEVNWALSSINYQNQHLKGKDRVIDICKIENASQYINLIGGQHLYHEEDFNKHDLDLKFIKSRDIKYKQFNDVFTPNLSVIDVLMFNSPDAVKEGLDMYDLI